MSLRLALSLCLLLAACAHAPTEQPELPAMAPPAAPAPGTVEVGRADALLRRGEAGRALALYREAWEAGNRKALTAYNAACASAREGASQEALQWLERAMEADWRDATWLRQDEDLASLRALPAFEALLARMEALPPVPPRTAGHPELRRLMEEDQADRRPPPATREQWAPVTARDAQRRARVAVLLSEGALHSAEDFYAAALVYQHGQSLADFARARELAAEAARRGHPQALWLAAAAWDRWLMTAGRPQRFGTQYLHGRLHPVDPEVSDAERAAWGFPPRAELPPSL